MASAKAKAQPLGSARSWREHDMAESFTFGMPYCLRVATDRISNLPGGHTETEKGLTMTANPLDFLVGRGRLELPTNGLKVRCSTN